MLNIITLICFNEPINDSQITYCRNSLFAHDFFNQQLSSY